MRAKRKETIFRVNASVALDKIQDTCRRNYQPEIFEPTYKPMLFESGEGWSKKNATQRSLEFLPKNLKETNRSSLSLADVFKERTQSASRTRTAFSRGKTPKTFNSMLNTGKGSACPSKISSSYINDVVEIIEPGNIEFFLRKLYFAKTKDLQIFPHPKQEKLFLSRLQRTVLDTQFVAVDCDLGTNSMSIILNYLKQRPIKLINLSKNPLGDENVIKLADLLPQFKLKELYLVSVNISSKCAALIMRSLAGHPTLNLLDLSSHEGQNRNRINTEGYKEIKTLLIDPMCQLHTIILSNTGMGEQGFLYFCCSFQEHSKLRFQSINLSNNEISVSEENYEKLRVGLSNIHILKFEIQNNALKETGGRLFADVLGVSYGRSNISLTLVFLDISGNCMKSTGFEKLCSALPHNKKLEELHFSNNNLTELEAFYSIKHLIGNTWSIKKLVMRKTLFCSASQGSNYMRYLAEGLVNNKSIKELDISLNEFDELGFVEIFASLEDNKTLKVLKMESCSIGDTHVQKAYDSIIKNQGIFVLNLSNNFLTDKGAALFTKILALNHIIHDMNIKKNCISSHLIDDISYQLRENRLMASSQEDPEFSYIEYVNSKQEEQRKSILIEIEKLDMKKNKLRVRDLAMAVIEKDDKINQKQQEIKFELNKIHRLEQEVRFAKVDKFKIQKKRMSLGEDMDAENYETAENLDTFLVTE